MLIQGPATIDGILISLDNSNKTQFAALVTVAMKGMYSTNGGGWSVSGITVLASHGFGHYDNLIQVVDTLDVDHLSKCGAAARCSEEAPAAGAGFNGFSMCSDMTADQWLALGGGLARKGLGVATPQNMRLTGIATG